MAACGYGVIRIIGNIAHGAMTGDGDGCLRLWTGLEVPRVSARFHGALTCAFLRIHQAHSYEEKQRRSTSREMALLRLL